MPVDESLATMAAALQRIATAVEDIAAVTCRSNQPAQTKSSKTETATSIGEKALLLVLRDRITCRAEIARRLGVHRSTIARMKDLHAAIFYVEVLSGRHPSSAREDPDEE